jgi:hypothetical protein
VRQDYNTDSFEDKPAEMPNIVELLLSTTPIYDFYSFDGNPNSFDNALSSENTKITLNRNAFFYAVRTIVENMSDEDYEKYVQNPLYIFDYVLEHKGFEGYKIHGLAENIIASFGIK